LKGTDIVSVIATNQTRVLLRLFRLQPLSSHNLGPGAWWQHKKARHLKITKNGNGSQLKLNSKIKEHIRK
jgi:hypothetical protein